MLMTTLAPVVPMHWMYFNLARVRAKVRPTHALFQTKADFLCVSSFCNDELTLPFPYCFWPLNKVAKIVAVTSTN